MSPRPRIDAESLLAHAGWMRELASNLLRDPGAADDVVQEACIAALRHPPAMDRPLEPWLSRVVRNIAWKRRRSDVRRAGHEASIPPREPEPRPQDTLSRLEMQRELVDAVRGVEEPLRTTLVLRYFEGRSGAEIARIQGVPEGTVRWRLKRALEELRERLDARYGSRESWGALLLPFAARPEAAVATAAAASASTVGSAAVTQGALTMGIGLKVGAALSAAAVAGVVWWGRVDGGTAVEPRAASVPAPLSAAEVAEPEARPVEDDAVREAAASAPRETAEPAATPEAAPPAVSKPPDKAPGAVTARFLDANGGPWSAVEVDCPGDSTLGPVRSGDDGRFDLSIWLGPMSSRHVELRARREGCATVVFPATVQPGETAHVGDIVLGPGVTLAGRVVDPEGRGIEGASVGICAVDLRESGLYTLDEARVHRHGAEAFGKHATSTSGTGGAFSLSGVAPGTWRLWGHAKDHRYAWTDELEIGLSDRFELELVLDPLHDEDRIEGRVVDPLGNPVPKCALTIAYEGERESGTTGGTCDDEGRFRVIVYVEGTYRLFATDPEKRFGTAGAFALKPGMLDVEIRLPEQRWVEVRAVDPDGAEVAGAKLELQEEERSTSERPQLSPEGRPRFLLPGYPFLLQVRAPGFRQLELGPLQPSNVGSTIEAKLERVPRLRGVVEAGGEPVVAQIQVVKSIEDYTLFENGFRLRMANHAEASGKSEDTGAFELDVDLALRDEVYVRVLADGWATEEIGPMSVEAAIARELSFDLGRGGVIEGRVILPDGRDGEGKIVGINFGDGDAITRRAGPGGLFRFERLTPGKWQVLHCAEEQKPGSIWVSSSDGEVKPIAWSCTVEDGRTTRYDLRLSE